MSELTREEFQQCYYKAWNKAVDKTGKDSRCWGDILADEFIANLTRLRQGNRPAAPKAPVARVTEDKACDLGDRCFKLLPEATSCSCGFIGPGKKCDG